MKVGVIGLGRMGNAIAYRLTRAGYTVEGFDFNKQACIKAENEGVYIVDSLHEIAKRNEVLWLMVPSGNAVTSVLEHVMPYMKADEIIIDGGNSKFNDSIMRAKHLKSKGILYLDCGTSGGLHGREQGFSLMVGGDIRAYTKVQLLFSSVAAPGGVAHVGPSGAGHYVKMVHNGIEYGLLQAYAEGFHILKEGSFKEAHLDLEKITAVWNSGSVIRSWLLELAHSLFHQDQKFEDISGEVDATGMGNWTVEEAERENIPASVIKESVNVRNWSKKTGGNYATKIVALLRKEFGGHGVKKNDDNR